jgi:NAD(P)-dependent dehydrogenase (short-subunit alcohol dehydrogenase family)
LIHSLRNNFWVFLFYDHTPEFLYSRELLKYKKTEQNQTARSKVSKLQSIIMKYAIVTGASPSSLGFLAAKKLASPEFGYKVILACRSSDKGRESEGLIRSAYPTSEVVYIHLDLSSFDSIRKFVDDVHALDDGAIVDTTKPGSSLKILVNNAGIGFPTPFVETSNGLEELVGVNHFGTFLLTQLLLEDLKRAEGGSRVVMVSSGLHEKNNGMRKRSGKSVEDEVDPSKEKLVLPDFPEGIFQSSENYDSMQAYQVSKLCNVWYAYELQRRLDEEAIAGTKSPIRVNALCPGFIPATGLIRHAGTFGIFFLRYVLDAFRHFGKGPTRSPEDGAEVIVQAGTSDVASTGGQYFKLPKGETVITSVASSEESMDEAKAKALWELSVKTCKLDA